MALFTLARWLGPWANAQKAPTVDTRDTFVQNIKVRFYGRSDAHRQFLIAPGLHYAAADDPRMDRFCRILAASGAEVVAPFIPDYLKLTPGRRAVADFIRVFDATKRGKPIIFSISFGSLLAFALAAERGAEISRLVIFGGYSDFHETMKFCLTGEVASGRQATRDPLNQPVVLMNLLHILEHDRTQTAALIDGWMQYVQATWGRPHYKVDRKFVAVAEAIAASVPESIRELYRVGIGVVPGAVDIAMPALAKFDAAPLDPSPFLPRVTTRVDLVHGMDDDVIPFEQSHDLAAKLVNADVRVHVTGLYGHTGASRPPLGALAKELATMVRVLRILAA